MNKILLTLKEGRNLQTKVRTGMLDNLIFKKKKKPMPRHKAMRNIEGLGFKKRGIYWFHNHRGMGRIK